MTDNQKIKNTIKQQLDIPAYKIQYALTTGILFGAYKGLKHYGIELNDETFDLFFNIVNDKLSGNTGVEYEWSEKEYEEIMNIKQFAHLQD